VITGLHAIVYTSEAEAVHAFFRDVLGWPHVDAHDGWLIFKTPPAELAAHPAPPGQRHELFLMCDDVELTKAELERRGVRFTTPVTDEGWGLLTYLELPGAGSVGLYQPKHPIAADLAPES
jgi:catechol 2,3-dioxygenase-like lactoylglutathione lyase family enzyme